MMYTGTRLHALMIGLSMVFLVGCSNNNTPINKVEVDLLVLNSTIYTCDNSFNIVQAMAIKDGKIVDTGTTEAIALKYTGNIAPINGAYIYPGFIDAHSHFYGYGMNLQKVYLVGTKSFDDVLKRVESYLEDHPDIKVIEGRGWDQNDWAVKKFPDKQKLDSLYPTTPVVLKRVDGHAVLANQAALNLAHITTDTQVEGGIIEVKEGKLTGILTDNAMDIVTAALPPPTRKQQINALLDAQYNCIKEGLTTVTDAGIDLDIMQLIDSLHKTGDLHIKVYAMLNPSEENFNFARNGIYKTDKLVVSSFKLYADGALGSRGACLLEEYCDHPKHFGQMVTPIEKLREYSQEIYDMGFQANTHCIGDSANRVMLNIYATLLKGKNHLRWRVEHAQVVNKNDFELFGKYTIIPSVQPTHATSDMYWADDRLCERLPYAYAYKTLLNQVGIIALGTDFPVEDISPIATFYAAVARMDAMGVPDGGFYKQNGLTREEALKGMTTWAAYASRWEKEIGSIEIGKAADFTVLTRDIMTLEEDKLLTAAVEAVYIDGKTFN